MRKSFQEYWFTCLVVFGAILFLPQSTEAKVGSTIPQVKVYSADFHQISAEFLAYQEGFRGGVDVAAGDLDGDRQGEIITGAGFTGGPQVRIFNSRGKSLKKDFFAYAINFRGGVSVATGDINGDGRDEIVTGAGPTGSPHVRVFNQKGEWTGAETFAYHSNFIGGLRLAARDLDNNGQIEIITAPGFKREEEIIICQGLCVALTFDDGFITNNSFAAILDLLKALKVKATFFILGKAIEESPDLIKRIVNEGHQLANHGYSHGDFTKMPQDQVRWEIINTEQLAQNLTAVSTKPYFRYPYRRFNDSTNQMIKDLGYQSVLWTIDSYDSRSTTSSAMVLDYTLRSLQSGAIILYHTQSLATVQALDQIITNIQNQGYNFALVREMP